MVCAHYRRIFAHVMVYIFAHLHTALRADENMLEINWLQKVKELVKINTCWNIWLFLSNIQGEIVSQKLLNLWVAKVLMSSYILCKILTFQVRVAQKVFNGPGSYLLAELIIIWAFNIQNWLFLLLYQKLNRIRTHDLWDTGAVLYQLSY